MGGGARLDKYYSIQRPVDHRTSPSRPTTTRRERLVNLPTSLPWRRRVLAWALDHTRPWAERIWDYELRALKGQPAWETMAGGNLHFSSRMQEGGQAVPSSAGPAHAQREARTGRKVAVAEEAPTEVPLYVCQPEELQRSGPHEQTGIRYERLFSGKMALNGYCAPVDLSPVRESWLSSSGRCANKSQSGRAPLNLAPSYPTNPRRSKKITADLWGWPPWPGKLSCWARSAIGSVR